MSAERESPAMWIILITALFALSMLISWAVVNDSNWSKTHRCVKHEPMLINMGKAGLMVMETCTDWEPRE